ncbi:MAG TPA: TIGR00341 family protein [Xenococcaceae cyanobacterium]
MTTNNPKAVSAKILNNRARKYFRLKITRFIRQFLPKQVKELYIKKLHRELWLDASWNTNYIVFTISACLIATFGLISNSTAVIIGAMLIAPLMLPLRSLAFAALEGDFPLFRKAFLAIIGATILALFLSSLTGHVIDIPEFGSEVLGRTQPNLVDLGIAVVAGSISAFAKVRRGVSDAIAGTAIAVALMPPLCVVGLALSQGQFYFAKGAFLLYITNLLGITLSCMMIFILAGYAKPNHTLGWTFALTSVLIVPLGASFFQLVRQSQLTTEITNKLLNETITVGEGVDNTRIEVDWTNTPPIVYIILQTDKEITAKQAALVEEFIEQKMNQPFDLVFIVSRVTRVTSKAAPSFDLINPEPQFYFTPLNKFPAFPTMPEQYTPNQFQVGK